MITGLQSKCVNSMPQQHLGEGRSKSLRKSAAMSLFCKLAELNLYSATDKYIICIYIYSKFCCSGMNTILTVVAMETIHHDYRPTYDHLYKKLMFNNDVAFDSLLCYFHQTLSKVQYVGGKHMMTCKCVMPFRHNTAILFSEYA